MGWRRGPASANPAGVLALLAVLAGCAEKAPKPMPVAFVDSPAFQEVRERSYGVLKAEREAVLVEQVEHGFVAARYVRDEQQVWRRVCQGPVLEGEDLEALRFVRMEQGQLLLVLVTSSNPDQMVQRFALLDVEDGCAVRFDERLPLPVPGEVISAGEVPGGVRISKSGVGLSIVDQPKTLHLEGEDGEVEVLIGVRERRLVGTAAEVTVGERIARFLEPRAVQIQWREALPEATLHETQLIQESESSKATPGPGHDAAASESAAGGSDAAAPSVSDANASRAPAGPVDLPELRDDDDAGSFIIRAGQAGTLVIEADGPVAILEVRHGCQAEEVVPLEMWHAGDRYVTGDRPHPGSFVRAVGRGHRPADSAWRDLLALRNPSAQLELDIAAHSADRCLREVRAFGFVELGEADPPSTPLDTPPPREY